VGGVAQPSDIDWWRVNVGDATSETGMQQLTWYFSALVSADIAAQ